MCKTWNSVGYFFKASFLPSSHFSLQQIALSTSHLLMAQSRLGHISDIFLDWFISVERIVVDVFVAH